MTRLSVNVNKVAVLRNSRGGRDPDVVAAAVACLDAGAHGITVHPRPDARHIRTDDVMALAGLTGQRGVEFNLEGNPFAPPRPGYPGFIALCEAARPAQATLVPDGDAQLTSDHGFDFERDADRLQPLIETLRAIGCRVSVFADAPLDPHVAATQAAAAARSGAQRIELYTGPYAEAAAHGGKQAASVRARFAAMALAAQSNGLGVNAGHDLSQANLAAFLAGVPGVLEVSIGHALISEALHAGLAATVRAYRALVDAQAQGRAPGSGPA
ncbi:pyridoxine 5'-phosphate synthase [Lysobacter sp. A3-1-A15]|uniref:pyridoxine 5'-phosphate synthase n=1 Tax=Novilysobacter viscosus TaxID=3098602 RepID=UPI002ED8E662